MRLGRLLRSTPHLAWFLCATAFSQNVGDAQVCEDFSQYRYIRTSQPSPPNGSVRQDNITDEEVREVQHAAREIYPDTVVIIGAVMEGCDCEDGGSCTAQVGITLNRENYQTRTLVLSRISGHWKVGAVQSWSIQYKAHQHQPGFPGWGCDELSIAWRKENQRLLESFPACPPPPANWKLVRREERSPTCVDSSSVQVTGFIRRMKLKSIFPVPQSIIPGYPRVKYTIDLAAFDCRDHRYRMDHRDSYYDDGRVEKNSGMDPVLWYPVRPDTELAADLDLVCRWNSK
jgi:hypothetical protein